MHLLWTSSDYILLSELNLMCQKVFFIFHAAELIDLIGYFIQKTS